MRTVARLSFRALALTLVGLAFIVTVAAAQVPPCDPSFHVPYGMHLRPLHPCGGDSVTLVFTSCRPCVDLIGYQRDSVGPIQLEARVMRVCPATLVCQLDSVEVPIGRLAVGRYGVLVQLNATVYVADSAVCRSTQIDSLAFAIGCPEPPPPVNSLPYVDRVVIGTPVVCPANVPIDSCKTVICPNQPIRVELQGHFPDGCFRFEKIELLPSMIVGPRPEPSIVRVTVSHRINVPCTLALVPWHADTVIAGLPPGLYELPLELQLVDIDAWADSNAAARDTTTYRAHRAFTVPDSCPLPPAKPCVWADWVHSNGYCDDFVAGNAAKAVMTIGSSVPLAGLQGELFLSPRSLFITNLTPVGRAEGMHIAWQRTLTGAKFMMFAEKGAPIGGLFCREKGPLCQEPVLAVAMVKDTDSVLPQVTHLSVGGLLGSDLLGAEVPMCMIETFAPIEARICAGPSCDFNRDGHLDVRDLVTMVHCILGSGTCPDAAGLDCNGDGRLSVDDVLCCARSILRGGERDTTGGRSEPGVSVAFGEPARTADGVDVPLELANPGLVGAARLVLDFPAARYDVAGVEFAQSSPEWLVLHEVVDGKLVVGVIGLGPAGGMAARSEAPVLGLRVRLAPKSGASGGGEVTIAEAQFSGPDGVTLVVPQNTAPAPLPGGGALALSAAPNPFAGETRLSLTLDRSADADVAVYDLGGRRVATLHRGALAAGPHEFVWRGTREDGGRAHAGVYFVRARVGGAKLARKVIFLRGD